jgi:hypothetical protein
MYKLLPPHPIYGDAVCIVRLSDGSVLPFDLANADYRSYLEWLAEGNTPLPADE